MYPTDECFYLEQMGCGKFVMSDSSTIFHGEGVSPEEAIQEYLEQSKYFSGLTGGDVKKWYKPSQTPTYKFRQALLDTLRNSFESECS